MNDYGEYESSEDREFHAKRREYRRYRHQELEAERWQQWPEEMARKHFNDYKNGGREKAIAILGAAEVARLDADALARWEKERAEDEYWEKVARGANA